MQHLNLEVRKTINPTFSWVEWGLDETDESINVVELAQWMNHRLKQSFNDGECRSEIFEMFLAMEVHYDISHFLDVLDELFPEE